MFNQVSALIRFFLIDYRFSVLIFWGIFTFTLLPLTVLSSSTNGSVIISAAMAVFIYSGISGFVLVKETFSYGVRMGASRQAFILSAFTFSALLALIMAAVSVVVTFTYTQLAATTWDNIQFLHLSESITGEFSWLTEFGLLSLFCFMFFNAGFFLATAFHRFGLVGGLGLLAIGVVALLVESLRTPIIEFFVSDIQIGAPVIIDLNFWAFPVTVVILAALIYIIFKNASIHPGAVR
ncbi:hypothetical protein JMA_33180 [Jeotgalibacillus malaysiensis]|uniref:Uncharacterized protein n=1 Tax=Jeotgalibacillus malaysiensis TaxID=1508404 RepID=A0A0B5AQW8_9BACL|nr:hypothetical protein [Jeotgalibacillus malaysiensis]AJD92635.1 hypothetical protein JMA_33180 [Jeotgalibacillus malaysiensis]